jgi:DNA-binding transcriptional LysR family regulator
MDWNDLRYVLAISRSGTLSAAAADLRVDQTTVTRRLAGIERATGARFFDRIEGRMVATDAGQAAITRAERIEAEAQALEAELSGADKDAAGVVRVTAVPSIVNRALVPRLSGLLSRYPRLSLEIVAEPGNLSLSKREADMAIRLARPPGGTTLCRRIGKIAYAVYGPRDSGGQDLPWLTYDEAHAHLPQARWIARHGRGSNGHHLRLNDAEALLQAVRAGLGRTLLPTFIADGDSRLLRLSPEVSVLEREVWLLVHPDVRPLPRISVVADWINDIFARLDATT